MRYIRSAFQSFHNIFSEAKPAPQQTSKMQSFATLVNGF